MAVLCFRDVLLAVWVRSQFLPPDYVVSEETFIENSAAVYLYYDINDIRGQFHDAFEEIIEQAW